jgi:hypothetical protein
MSATSAEATLEPVAGSRPTRLSKLPGDVIFKRVIETPVSFRCVEAGSSHWYSRSGCLPQSTTRDVTQDAFVVGDFIHSQLSGQAAISCVNS